MHVNSLHETADCHHQRKEHCAKPKQAPATELTCRLHI